MSSSTSSSRNCRRPIKRFESYVRGINRYVDEVVVPDPLNKLPFEFHHLGIGVPVPWTAMDAFAFGVREMRGFLERGDVERNTQALLNSLVVLHGLSAGLGVFNDVQWTNDPDGSATVPQVGAIGKKQHDVPPPNQLATIGVDAEPIVDDEAARTILESVAVPTSLGSHDWVVSAAHSTEGGPMLFGGPQLALSTPDFTHEVQLKGPDVNVAGMSFAGIPSVLIGRTSHIAWTAMSAFFNNVDTYVKTLCNAGGGAGSGYLFNGVCTLWRTETIQIKGSAPLVLTVERSIHGPVVAAAPGVKFTRKEHPMEARVPESRRVVGPASGSQCRRVSARDGADGRCPERPVCRQGRQYRILEARRDTGAARWIRHLPAALWRRQR
jgi:penicillin G amidase